MPTTKLLYVAHSKSRFVGTWEDKSPKVKRDSYFWSRGESFAIDAAAAPLQTFVIAAKSSQIPTINFASLFLRQLKGNCSPSENMHFVN